MTHCAYRSRVRVGHPSATGPVTSTCLHDRWGRAEATQTALGEALVIHRRTRVRFPPPPPTHPGVLPENLGSFPETQVGENRQLNHVGPGQTTGPHVRSHLFPCVAAPVSRRDSWPGQWRGSCRPSRRRRPHHAGVATTNGASCGQAGPAQRFVTSLAVPGRLRATLPLISFTNSPPASRRPPSPICNTPPPPRGSPREAGFVSPDPALGESLQVNPRSTTGLGELTGPTCASGRRYHGMSAFNGASRPQPPEAVP